MSSRRIASVLLIVAALVAAPGIAAPSSAAPQDAATAGARTVWLGPDGQPVPFASDTEVLEFLRTAAVVSIETIPSGITKPRKVLLESDGIRAHAVFRDVDVSKDRVRLRSGEFYYQLHDSGLFEVAAYRLALLLGIDNVPPTVVRRIGATEGSLQLWIENAMTERSRREGGLAPTDFPGWLEQMRTMSLFDSLVGNIDRHTGNYLLDSRGKLWMIDHTRAFQRFLRDWSPRKIALCDRQLWERLQVLDEETLKETLGDFLTPFEIEHLADRLKGVVAHIEEQIATRGESNVIT